MNSLATPLSSTQTAVNVGLSSQASTNSSYPRHAPDSGVALSTDLSFSPALASDPQMERKRSLSLSEISNDEKTDSLSTDQRPNSANAVLSKLPISGQEMTSSTFPSLTSAPASTVSSSNLHSHKNRPFSSIIQGTMPLTHTPPKPNPNHFTVQHVPAGQMPCHSSPYGGSPYPSYVNYSTYTGVSPLTGQQAVYSPAYNTPHPGSHYYQSPSGSAGYNFYNTNSRYPTYLSNVSQRHSTAMGGSYAPQSSLPPTFSSATTYSEYSPVSSNTTPQRSSYSQPSPNLPGLSPNHPPKMPPPLYIHESPAEPVPSSQTLPTDEAHTSPAKSTTGPFVSQDDKNSLFPVVSLSISENGTLHSNSISDRESGDEQQESEKSVEDKQMFNTR